MGQRRVNGAQHDGASPGRALARAGASQVRKKQRIGRGGYERVYGLLWRVAPTVQPEPGSIGNFAGPGHVHYYSLHGRNSTAEIKHDARVLIAAAEWAEAAAAARDAARQALLREDGEVA